MVGGQGAMPSLGAGYDTFDGVIKHSIVNVIHHNNNGPSEIGTNWSVCTTTEEVMEKLKINASIEANAKWGSLSAKVDYAQSLCRSSTSVVVLLVITKVSQHLSVERVEFSDTFKDDEAEMFKQGGDSYVSYIKEGESIDSQKSIAAELNADINKVKGDLKVAYDRVNARKDIKFKFSLNAIGFGKKSLPKEEELSKPYDFISDINKGKLEEPDILEFATRLYDGVKGHPDMSQIVGYHSLFTRDLEGKKAYSTFKRQTLKTKMAIKSLAEVYEFYHQEGVEPQLDKNRRKVEESLRKINDWQYAVHTNPTSTTIGELALDPSCLEVPEPQFHLERSGLRMETDKGDAWEDVDLSMVMQRMYLRSIQVRAGGFIDMLTTVYGFADAYREDFKREHGAGRAGAQEKFVLGPNQRIDKLELWHQDYHGSPIVKMFAIYTEGNPQRIFFGNDEPIERPYSDQGKHGNANWAFLGFSGRSG